MVPAPELGWPLKPSENILKYDPLKPNRENEKRAKGLFRV